MYRIDKDNTFVDSIVSENENYGKSVEMKILLNATDDEIKSRFHVELKEVTLVAYVTLNKYKKTIDFITLEVENIYGDSLTIYTPLSIEEIEVIRKAAIAELGRMLYK